MSDISGELEESVAKGQSCDLKLKWKCEAFIATMSHDLRNHLPFYGYSQASFVPGSQFARGEFQFSEDPATHVPSTCSVESTYKGIFKSAHAQVSIPVGEFKECLRWMKTMFGPYLMRGYKGDSKSNAVRALDGSKAAGKPWKDRGWTKKWQVVQGVARELGLIPELSEGEVYEMTDSDCEKVFDVLEKQFMEHPSEVIATAKDELRLKEKAGDSRTFNPEPAHTIVEGNLLFKPQNDGVTEGVLQHPATVGLQTPGGQVCALFGGLARWAPVSPTSGCADADGAQWDMWFPMWVAMLIMNLRLSFLDPSLHARAVRYYEQVYSGLVHVGGAVYQMMCQRSGQTNTSIDNSLAEAAIFCLRGIRAGLTYEQFRNTVLFYANGDDIIWSSKTAQFSPREMLDLGEAVGVHYEFSTLEFKSVLESTFIGLTPVMRTWQDRTIMVYRYNQAKLLSSASYWKKGTDELDHMAKLIAIVTLLWGTKDLYEKCRAEVITWLLKKVQLGSIVESSPRYTGMLPMLVDESEMFTLYTSLPVWRTSSLKALFSATDAQDEVDRL